MTGYGRSMSLLAIAVWSTAHAGAPDVWTGRTPVGELQPRATVSRMVDEELEVRILDLDFVEVRATYQVHNPGTAPEVVRWAVPLTSGGTGGSDGASAEAASVRVLMGGVFIPCLVSPGEGFELPVPSAVGANRVDRWCTADVTLQPGLSELRLSFEGALLYEASSTPAALAAGGVDRTFVHALFPASGWSKRPDEIRITFDAGPFVGRATPVQPPNARVDGRFISWTLPRPDVTQTRFVVVSLKAADRDQHARIATHNANGTAWARPSGVKASGNPAAAARMSDGDGATAWCASGRDAWVELAWARPPAGTVKPSCAVGLLAIPGDAASEASWTGSGRPTRVRASMCGSRDGVELPLTVGPAFDATGAAVVVPPALATPWLEAMGATDPKAPPVCVRVQVLDSLGSPACFSELAWQASCP